MAKKGTFARGTKAQRERSKIAEDIHMSNPNMPMGEKMAIATNIEKKRLRGGKRQSKGKEI